MTNFDIQFLSRIFENSSTLLIETANHTGEPITAVSPNVGNILGYFPQALEGGNLLFDDLLHDDDVANYLLETQQATFSEDCDELVHSEYRIKQKEGNYIWVKDHAQIIRDKKKVTRIVHVITDISDEVSIREQIEAQKSRLKSLLHHAGFGMWEWNTAYDTVDCDENWCHLIGFVKNVENMNISRLFALIHPEELTKFKDVLKKLKSGENSKGDLVIRIRHLSGKWRYHHCHANVYSQRASQENSNEAPIIFVSHNDITGQKENELAAISALATRNQFFARVSHEIRTPLHGMLGMLGLVKQDMKSERAIQKIDKITAHSEHLLYLLNDILDLAKLNEAKLKISIELVSVTEIINQVHRLFSFKAQEKSIGFITTLPPLQEDMVVTDKVRLTQVLSNLVSNAIKYTHAGHIHLFTKIEDSVLILCIQDTGIGIKDTNSVFDAYKQEQGGYEQGVSSTGLGLEIVKKLCDTLGIEIRLSSNKKGTLFELVLSKPMPNTMVASQSIDAENTTQIRFDGKRVLVVDDSDINREIVEEILTMAGATCVHAVDGYEAVKAVSTKPGYDIVLMDKHMPKMNGIDATREIRKNNNIEQPIIIALTADAFDIDNEQWYEQGIDELITKPFDMDILLKTIRRCLRK